MCPNNVYEYFCTGKKHTYEGTVKNYFVDYRPADLQTRVTSIQNTISAANEKHIVKIDYVHLNIQYLILRHGRNLHVLLLNGFNFLH